VRHPGVYEFREGDRVIDAIHAAGGPRRGAVLESLNLAAPLADGTQVLVPRPQPAVSAGSAGAGTAAPAKININTATAAELDALPGVGEVIAQHIVDYRTTNGPFRSVDDLLDVSGIGPVTLEDMRSMVTV
jgi:competence protein ComEA